MTKEDRRHNAKKANIERLAIIAAVCLMGYLWCPLYTTISALSGEYTDVFNIFLILGVIVLAVTLFIR